MKTPGLLITIIGSAVFIAVMWVVKEAAKGAYDTFGGVAAGTALVMFVLGGLIYDQWSRRPPNER